MFACVEGVAGSAPRFETDIIFIFQGPKNYSCIEIVVTEDNLALMIRITKTTLMARNLRKSGINFFEIKVKVTRVGMEGFRALVEVLGGGNIKGQSGFIGDLKIGMEADRKGHFFGGKIDYFLVNSEDVSLQLIGKD